MYKTKEKKIYVKEHFIFIYQSKGLVSPVDYASGHTQK